MKQILTSLLFQNYSNVKFFFLICFLFALSFLFLSGVGGTNIENSTWLDKNHPLEQQRAFTTKTFGLSENFLLIFKDKNLFSIEILKGLQAFEKEILANKEIKKLIKKIESPLNISLVYSTQDDQVIIKNSYHLFEKNQIPLKTLRDLAHQNPYIKSLIGENNNFLVSISTNKKLSYIEQKILFKELKKTLINFPVLNPYSLSGDLFIKFESNEKTISNLKKVSILSIICCFFIFLIIFRSLKSVFVIITPAFFNFSLCLFLIVFILDKINILTIILPCTIFVIALSDSIHIFYRSRLLSATYQGKELFKASFKDTFLPCFITSFTTGVGFSSFIFSEILTLKNFSLISMPIIIFTLLVICFLSNYLSSFLLHKQEKMKPLNLFTKTIFSYQRIILLLMLLSFLFLIPLKSLQVQGSLVNMFFSEQSSITKNLNFLDEKFLGSMSFDLVLKSEKGDFFKKIENYNKVIKLQEDIKKNSLVKQVLSYNQQVQMIHKTFSSETPNPISNEQLEQELFFINLSYSDEKQSTLSSYVNFNFSTLRLLVRTKQISVNGSKKLIGEIETLAKNYFPNIEVFTSGGSKNVNAISYYILKSQLRSLFITVGVIFILFWLAFGLKLSFVAMIVNIIPVLVTLGTMSMLSIHLDLATVLINAISFSLCVDNSSHFIHFFKKQKFELNKSLLLTLNLFIKPFSLTILILIIGLGSFVFSDLLLLERFGTFSSLSLITALFCDTLLLPILLKSYRN